MKVALLRGINVSGKNKIPMEDLKRECVQLGFQNVSTLLNSGNVLFDSQDEHCAEMLQEGICERFDLDIPVYVTDTSILDSIFKNAPSWWNTSDKSLYDNFIFVIPPMDVETIVSKIGQTSAGLEQIEVCEHGIYWTFILGKHSKANWWKMTASEGIGNHLTIRTANTLQKIIKKSLTIKG